MAGFGNARGPWPADRGRIRLFWRVFASHAAVLLVATSVLALSPATISVPSGPLEALVLVLGLTVLLGTDLWLLRRAFSAFDELVAFVRGIDPAKPGSRAQPRNAGPDVRRIAAALNATLARLEGERAASARRLVEAQEEERARVARELHDEVGQLLTVAMLHVDTAPGPAPDAVASARTTLERAHASVRRIAHQLRPALLDDLGLANALLSLAASFGDSVRVRTDVSQLDGEAIAPEVELAVYRVAQEACANAVRHAGASTVWLLANQRAHRVTLTVADDGHGLPAEVTEGRGLFTMRERAALAGGELLVGNRPGGGTVITLRLQDARGPAALAAGPRAPASP